MIRLLKTIVMGMLLCTALTGKAQEQTALIEQCNIAAFLDSVPGIYAGSLNFSDFFAESSVSAKVVAGKDGNVQRIKIGKRNININGNCDPVSIKTARKLLVESSKSIIRSKRWKPGKSRCTILWKPRYSKIIKKRDTSKIIESIAGKDIIESAKKKLKGADCSAYIIAETDTNGIVKKTRHIGNIHWGEKELSQDNGKIGNLDISFNSGNSSSFAIMRLPYRVDEKEREQQRRDRIVTKSAETIGKGFIGKHISTITGCEEQKRRTCIEINIDATEVEIEQTNPVFPGGAQKLKELFVESLKKNKTVKKYNVTGNIRIKLNIKKNGKAEVWDVSAKIPASCCKSSYRMKKIKEKIHEEITRTAKKMPRWTPGTCDGEPEERQCTFKIEL